MSAFATSFSFSRLTSFNYHSNPRLLVSFRWGESGYIRILRTPGNEPCATDPTPLDGVCGKGACKCNATVKYCGTCGILADSSYPIGAKLLSAPLEYATGYVWKNSTAKIHAPILAEAAGFEDIVAATPASFDWRKKGNVVSPVKDQGQCGACVSGAGSSLYSCPV